MRGAHPGKLAERAVPPSSLSLLGLVRHMGEVEIGWFRAMDGRQRMPRYYSDDNPDGDFGDARGDDECVRDAFDYWRDAIAYARKVAARTPLEQTFANRHGEQLSLRWLLLHMIEEYARHCGHADLLRERIDGVTGD